MINVTKACITCAICLESGPDGATLSFQTLPCHSTHQFHTMCWQQVIANAHPNNPSCPLCRIEIVVLSSGELILAAVAAINGQQTDQEQRRESLLAAVRRDGSALEFASLAIQNDREVVITAVEQNGYALQFASAALKNDREVVLAAVEQNGHALAFASDALKNDREVFLAARQ